MPICLDKSILSWRKVILFLQMDRTLNQIILATFILEFHFGILDDQIPDFSVLFWKHLKVVM